MDNGFGWLASLPADLYAQLGRLMDFVAEGDHVGVDGLVPGIVAQARREKNAWVEVFARNFELRSLILHRGDVRNGMAKAVALLDRAHEPDAQDCPQSICTAHAVCAAYRFRDGPGYAADRLAVSAETLARIDPRRVCWICISNEHAEALIDGGRPREALDFLDQQGAIRVAGGAPLDPDDFGVRQASALLALGLVDDGLAQLEKAASDYRGASWQRGWRMHKARLLAERGDLAEALRFLSSPEDVERDGGFRLHFDTLPLLYGTEAAAAAGLKDTHIITQMITLGKVAVARGIARAGQTALLWAASKLTDLHQPTLAGYALDQASEALSDLCNPGPFKTEVAIMRARIAALPTVVPVDVPNSFEEDLVTFAASPTAQGALAIADTWACLDEADRAQSVLAIAADACPDNEMLFEERCELLLQASDFDALSAVLKRPPATPDGPVIARVYEAEAALQRGDDAAHLAALMAVHAQRPAWTDTAEDLGFALWDAERFAEAGAVWARAAGVEEPNDFNWLCIQAATAIGDWRTVREHVLVTGSQVEINDAPLMGEFGDVRVTLPDDDRPLLGRLISPAIVRVLSLRNPGGPQWFDAEVLVAPWPHNADARDEDGWIPLHEGLIIRSRPPIECVAIDGADPGEVPRDRLLAALSTAGFHVQISAGADYQVADPATGDSAAGLYWMVATTHERAEALLQIFTQVKGPGVRVWPELLRLLGHEAEAEAHDALAREWGMI